MLLCTVHFILGLKHVNCLSSSDGVRTCGCTRERSGLRFNNIKMRLSNPYKSAIVVFIYLLLVYLEAGIQ